MATVTIYCYNYNILLQLQYLITVTIYGNNNNIWLQLQYMVTVTIPVFGYNYNIW